MTARVVRRSILFSAMVLALLVYNERLASAQTDIVLAERDALNLPSHLTPRAVHGLFTSVARAGDRLVAVGERGRILISGDNGNSWRQIATPTSVTLTRVVFATPQDGWAVGGMGIVLHSGDGGLTWSKQLDGTQAANIALAAAQADVKQGGSNDTTTANLQSAQELVSGGANVPFLDVYAESTKDVIITGAFGMAFSSADGGTTWSSLADFLPDPNGLHIYQITKDDNNFAVAGEQGFALFGPAGKPLATISTPFDGSFFGETFAPDHSWLLFGLQGTILRSTDNGAHWSTILAGAPVGIDCGIVLASGQILLGNIAGQLLDSHDNGQHYAVIQLNEPVVNIVQAADGAIIAAGPSGMRRIALDRLSAGT